MIAVTEHNTMFHQEPSTDELPTYTPQDVTDDLPTYTPDDVQDSIPPPVDPTRPPVTRSTRPRHPRGGGHTTKHLNFMTAMEDFEIMFPDMERHTIENALRANKGVVQSTIDQLLQLQRTNEMRDKLSGYADHDESDPEVGDEPPPAYSPVWEGDEEGRVDIEQEPTSPSEEFMTEEELAQCVEDEKLAMFLQNDEFVRALKHNPEFVRSLESDIANQRAERGLPPSMSVSLSATASKEPNPVQVDDTLATNESEVPEGATGGDDQAFRQKLKHMGKSTKKKFGRIANKFSKMRSRGLSFSKKSSKKNFSRLEEEQGSVQQMNATNEATEGDDLNEGDQQAETEFNEEFRSSGEIEVQIDHHDNERSGTERSHRIAVPPGTPEVRSRDNDSGDRIIIDSDDSDDNEVAGANQ